MSRLLIKAFESAGHTVHIASSLRSFVRDATNTSAVEAIQNTAEQEIERLSQHWLSEGCPSAWFCYHPYYKSPDLIGPTLCERHDVPYITAEASYSNRRNSGAWEALQSTVLHAVNHAAVNLCFTQRDLDGLRAVSTKASLQKIHPFIDIAPFLGLQAQRRKNHLIVVAMMRSGDKMHSYQHLAEALTKIDDVPWTLSVVGHGPLYDQVRECFSGFSPERIQWHGLLEQADIASLLASSELYVWPGCGEAYGLAYLEAQAAGLPVVAYDIAGVPEVVDNGNTGLLTPPSDTDSYAQAIASLLGNNDALKTMAARSVDNVQAMHSLEQAGTTLNAIVQRYAAK